MAIGITSLTGFSENPYLTLAEYKNAPTSIDFDNLVVGGNAQAQDAELARVILRATSYLNEYLNQDLTAELITETQRVRFNNQGFIALHPNKNPIISLNTFEFGSTPNNLTALTDPSTCWFENQQVIIPVSNSQLTYSSQGPLSFGGVGAGTPVFVKYSYVAGYVNTTFAANASLGATSITVTNGAGFIAGEQYRIFDGASTETITVASNYTYGSTTVPITAALTFAHTSGVAISNLPNAVKQAAILTTTAFIKARGDNSLTMAVTTSPSGNISGAQRFGSDLMLALDMVSLYRRIR
jgi:hypothetical protein